jgi:hypothetical protein
MVGGRGGLVNPICRSKKAEGGRAARYGDHPPSRRSYPRWPQAQMAASCGAPGRNAKGTLQATVPSAASELRSALTFAAGNEASIGKTGLAIRLTEPDVPPVFAHVLPLTGSDFRTRLQPAAVAAVFIGAPPPACSPGARWLRPPQCLASPGRRRKPTSNTSS